MNHRASRKTALALVLSLGATGWVAPAVAKEGQQRKNKQNQAQQSEQQRKEEARLARIARDQEAKKQQAEQRHAQQRNQQAEHQQQQAQHRQQQVQRQQSEQQRKEEARLARIARDQQAAAQQREAQQRNRHQADAVRQQRIEQDQARLAAQRQRQAEQRQHQAEVTARQQSLEHRGHGRVNGRVQARAQAHDRRLSRERQQYLIDLQRQRTLRYEQELREAEALAAQQAANLQRQQRTNQYRYQQQYLQRLRQQQQGLQRYSNYDYGNDPYFYTEPSYQYLRGGRTYQTNQYGAQLLQEAINQGYEEGYRAAQADLADGWRSDSRNSYGYRDANYGYNGLYVEQEEYQHYFREGFSRGYDDGYARQNRYGTRSSNGSNLMMLAEVLMQILQLQSLR